VLSEKWSSSAVEIQLEQGWFLSDGSEPSAEEAGKLWTIPLLFATPGSVSNSAVLMTTKTQTFNIPLQSAGDWLKINAGQQALVRVAYTPELTSRLNAAIRSAHLSVVDRAAVLLDAYALAKAGLAPVESVVDLLKAYDNETNSTVWSAIQGVLGGLNLLLEEIGGVAFQRFTDFASKIVKSALDKVSSIEIFDAFPIMIRSRWDSMLVCLYNRSAGTPPPKMDTKRSCCDRRSSGFSM